MIMMMAVVVVVEALLRRLMMMVVLEWWWMELVHDFFSMGFLEYMWFALQLLLLQGEFSSYILWLL